MLGVLGEVTVADTDPQDEAEFYFRHASARRWPALAERLCMAGNQVIAVRFGTMVIAIPRANHLDRLNLTAIAAAAQRLGLGHATVDPSRGIRRLPGPLQDSNPRAPYFCLMRDMSTWP